MLLCRFSADSVKGQHSSLQQSVNFRHWTSLLTVVNASFQRRFHDFLQLSPRVNAILATMTHPYFKLSWLPERNLQINKVDWKICSLLLLKSF